ncbi:MAG: hypothetical protein IT370_10515 [Deltaproteobacteria bacterium]|nr:hypothetical protein [Deltaproteobacteria bacterium]
MSKTTRSIALSLSVALAAVALVETAAHAKKSSGRGALFVSGKSFPTKASSENALRAAAKKTSQKNIAPTDPEATKEWAYNFNIMAFFGRALDDSQITIKVYDITDGTLRLISTFEQYLRGRGQQSYISTVSLKHPDQDIRPNRKYLLKMSSKSGPIAEATFTAGGKVPKVTGNVVFEEGEGN